MAVAVRNAFIYPPKNCGGLMAKDAVPYAVGGAAAGAATSATVGGIGLGVLGGGIGLGLLSLTGVGLVAGLALYGAKKALETKR